MHGGGGAAGRRRRGALASLDELAAGCDEPSFDGLRVHLFERVGFRGNRDDYADPDNSFLDRVIDRRLGIPITLSVVMIEVGRRLGVRVVGIGMPAHFLVRVPATLMSSAIPSTRARVLDEAGCAALFDRLAAGTRPFDRRSSRRSTRAQVLSRMLNNLEHGRLSDDPHAARDAARVAHGHPRPRGGRPDRAGVAPREHRPLRRRGSRRRGRRVPTVAMPMRGSAKPAPFRSRLN